MWRGGDEERRGELRACAAQTSLGSRPPEKGGSGHQVRIVGQGLVRLCCAVPLLVMPW